MLRVSKWSQRSIDQPDNLAQMDLRWWPTQLVAAFGAAHALHDARVLHFQKNQLQKLFRQIFFVRDVAYPDRSLPRMPRQHHQGLERVQPFLRNLHIPSLPINSIDYIDIIDTLARDLPKTADSWSLNRHVVSWVYGQTWSVKPARSAEACSFRKLRV